MTTSALGQEQGWLGAVPGGPPEPQDSANPFVRFRHGLWSYHRAMAAGWSDTQFVERVEQIDSRLVALGGPGFTVTPVSRFAALSEAAGVDLRVKNETGGPGGSHKARHLMGIALHLAVDEAQASTDPDALGLLAISSCGNAALGAATVAAALDRPLSVFVPDWADQSVTAAIQDLGGQLQVCTRAPGQQGDPCMAAFVAAVDGGALPFSVQSTANQWATDGGRLAGWELVYQTIEDPLEHVVIQVGGGALASSVFQAFVEAHEMGVIEELPKLHAAQTEGCAPLHRAMGLLADAGGLDALPQAVANPSTFMWPWEDEPHSLATGILDDVTYDWLGIANGVLLSGGSSVVVNEHDVATAHQLAHQHSDVPVCVTGAAGLAGVLHAAPEVIPAGAKVAVLFTGHDRL